MQIDIREFFKPEDSFLRHCSYFIVVCLNGGTDDEIRASAVAPSYEYLGAAIATVLFEETVLTGPKVAVLKTVSEAVAPASAWTRSTFHDYPIDTVVQWTDESTTVEIRISAMIDNAVGPCKLDAYNIKENPNVPTE